MADHHIIKEYDLFTKNPKLQLNGYTVLNEKTFDALEQLILSNSFQNDTDALEFLTLSSKKGVGKVIRAKNYVGTITMRDGTTIEIFPKIYSKDQNNDDSSRKILLDMIKTLNDFPYKEFNISNLKTEKMSIFEIFVRMFIDETFTLVKRGLKSNYVLHSDNEYFFKGKIKFSEHIKHNFAHKERTFIEYDVFSNNMSENRLKNLRLHFLEIAQIV